MDFWTLLVTCARFWTLPGTSGHFWTVVRICGHFPGGSDTTVELMAVDFKDAFHTFPVHESERKFQIARGTGDEYIGYDTVVFGGAGSPLV